MYKPPGLLEKRRELCDDLPDEDDHLRHGAVADSPLAKAHADGLEAQEHARRLSEGSRIGLSGRLDHEGHVLIDQLDLL